jgi:hypothetical protein
MRKIIVLGGTLALAAAALAGQVTVGTKEITMTLPFCGT